MPVPLERRSRRTIVRPAVVLSLLSLLSPLALWQSAPAEAAPPAGAANIRGEINIMARHSGRCVEVEESSVQTGAPVIQTDCTGQAGAIWTLRESIAGGGSVNIVNVNSGMCVQVQGTATGSPVQQAACSETASGMSFKLADRGTHVWLQPHPASPTKCLQVRAGSHVPGSPLVLADCSDQSGTAFLQRIPAAGNAPAGEPNGGVQRANLGPADAQTPGLGRSLHTSGAVSGDGRFVAFTSTANNLAPGDTNNAADVFVRDQGAGTTVRVSVSSAEVQGQALSDMPAISADGRYVAFRSFASNLVAGDYNSSADVFVRDMLTGTTELVSRNALGDPGTGPSSSPSLSADGREVSFTSNAANLVPGDTNDQADIFVRDRQTAAVERVSVSGTGAQGDRDSLNSAISGDGRFVAFESDAVNLVAQDVNEVHDVFVRDRLNGTTELVSVASNGTRGVMGSFAPSISADGRFVAFVTAANELTPGGTDTNGDFDVLLRDRQSGATEWISANTAGPENRRGSFAPSLSADGRFVAFVSELETLTPFDTNGAADVFVRDRSGGALTRASVNGTGDQGDGASDQVRISANGQYLSFRSTAGNLVAGDTNAAHDLFVRPRPGL